MIVQKEVSETTGRCGGRYMEDRPRYQKKIFCDRCGREKKDGIKGLGWCLKKPVRSIFDIEDKDRSEICPDCLETEDEYRTASIGLQKYIHHSIWARGSRIGRTLKAIEQEQTTLFGDCLKVKELLNRFNPENKQSLVNKIDQALKSAGIKQDQHSHFVISPPKTDPHP